MKRVLLIISIIAMTFALAYAAAEPDTVNLKEAWQVEGKQKAVTFDHKLHTTKNDCTECHATAEGGKWRPESDIAGNNQKNAAHNLCWTCDTEMKVTVGKTCTKCHKG